MDHNESPKHAEGDDEGGGYRVRLVGSIVQHYLCLICNLLLRKPMQAACGDRMCSSCVAKLFRFVYGVHNLPENKRKRISEIS